MAEIREDVVERVDAGASYPPEPGYPAVAQTATARTRSSTVTAKVSGNETGRRVIMLLFGIVQAVIILRIALLLLDAREGNDLVASILSFSQIFVGPFEGIFRTDALNAGGSILDLTAIAALVGWTLLEFLVLAIYQIITRRPASAAY